MKSVEDMLRGGADRQSVLKTMPKRERQEQEHVWSEGLARIQQHLTRVRNKAADALLDHVAGGAIRGLFYDPLDQAKAYARDELRRSRSREEGERKRQLWLMDLLVIIGHAEENGVERLIDYPPAAALMEQAPEEAEAA